MGLFSKTKVPGINTDALNAINLQTANKQKDLITQKLAGLQPLNQQFGTQRKELSASIEPGAEKTLTQYGADLSQVGTQEKAARDAATNTFREQQFRDVPAIQQAIRNSLGGNRLLGSGAALSSLAKPTIQAAQNASDFAANNEQERLANAVGRSENMATTGLSTRQKAMADRLGMDEGTINQLTAMGRTDLIDKFNSLAGVESDYGANQLAIEQAKQANDIAQATAANANKQGITSSLGSLAGMGLGFATGTGPLGAAVGSQIGGTIGGFAGGGTPQQFDPTLLYALAQRNKKAVTASTGGK
jgi:hypothetical protein